MFSPNDIMFVSNVIKYRPIFTDRRVYTTGSEIPVVGYWLE